MAEFSIHVSDHKRAYSPFEKRPFLVPRYTINGYRPVLLRYAFMRNKKDPNIIRLIIVESSDPLNKGSKPFIKLRTANG
jgi:hypothetical protein